MAKLTFLGTASAVPDENQENTHMALLGKEGLILIDAPNNPTVRLKKAGLDEHLLTDLILTHFHPDHVGGVPSLIMNLWLTGRKESLCVHGLEHTLGRIEKIMEFYDWKNWPNFYPVNFCNLSNQPMELVLENQDFRILSSPVCHMVPGIGLRIEAHKSGKIIAYSSDTEPCQEVVRLARNADILIHEASNASIGHSSAEQAGEIAQKAQVKSLYLIHYPTRNLEQVNLIKEARNTFSGAVHLSRDLDTIEI